MPPPSFSEDQRTYLTEFNFEALLRKYPECQHHERDASDESWTTLVKDKLHANYNEMELYKQLRDIAERIIKDTGHCALTRVDSSVVFLEGQRSYSCLVSVRVECALVTVLDNPIFEALRRDNYEMLAVRLAAYPELVNAQYTKGVFVRGDTPLGYVLSHMHDIRTLQLLLNHGALPKMSVERFVRYNTPYRKLVARKWRKHIRHITLIILSIGATTQRHQRHEFAAFARATWTLKNEYC
jgi:hypothetical protein